MSGDVVALGVDVGTTNTKVVLVAVGAATVRALATASAPTPTDVHDLVATVGRLTTDAVRRHPGVHPQVVGVASMAETGVALDTDDAPLTGLLRWDGHRAGEEAAALARTHGRAELFAATGVRASAKVPLATWAWLRAQGVRMHRWAGVADVVVLALTGRLMTDHTLAGRTMAYRAVADGPPPAGFDADLLAAVGLRPGQLPDVAAPDAVAARVGDARPRSTGGLAGVLADHDVLRSGTPVVVAGHDHAVGAWAAGVRRPGDHADSVGTAEAVLTVLPHAPEPGPVAAAGMSWVRSASGRHHALLAGSSSAGSMLGWVAEQAGGALDDALARAAVLAAEGADDLVVLPYLHGRQTPAPDPDARVAVVRRDGTALGLEEVRRLATADPGRLAHATLAGVCLQARWMSDAQRALGAVSGPGVPLVLGGAARAVPAWAALKRWASPGGLTWVLAEEPVAVGAALLAAARAGLLGPPAAALESAPVLAVDRDGPLTRPRDVEVALERFVAAATGGTSPAH